jgi:hypothetical protein
LGRNHKACDCLNMRFPVIATTSKLRSTGVDAKTCKLIVLDQTITTQPSSSEVLANHETIGKNGHSGFIEGNVAMFERRFEPSTILSQHFAFWEICFRMLCQPNSNRSVFSIQSFDKCLS